MPWHCPACQTIIRHSELDPKPRGGERYRCHVCRLTLDFDEPSEKLVIAPFETDHLTQRRDSDRPRRIPSTISTRPKAKPRRK
jgi:rubredoxin